MSNRTSLSWKESMYPNSCSHGTNTNNKKHCIKGILIHLATNGSASLNVKPTSPPKEPWEANHARGDTIMVSRWKLGHSLQKRVANHKPPISIYWRGRYSSYKLRRWRSADGRSILSHKHYSLLRIIRDLLLPRLKYNQYKDLWRRVILLSSSRDSPILSLTRFSLSLWRIVLKLVRTNPGGEVHCVVHPTKRRSKSQNSPVQLRLICFLRQFTAR